MEKVQKNLEMERAVRGFEAMLRKAGAGTINESLAPSFVECSVEERRYTAAVHGEQWMCNPWGTMHGGIIATALDSCMGIAAFYFCGERSVRTVSMQTAYLAPAYLDQALVVESRVIQSGQTIQNVRAVAWCDGNPDKIVATADGVYYALPEKLRIEEKDGRVYAVSG